MSQDLEHGLSKRERQVMNAVYRLREASAAEVQGAIPNPPGNSSVRTTLSILVRRRLLTTRKDGRKLLYSPAISPHKARSSAIRQLVRTYFDDSAAAAVSALLSSHAGAISEKEYEELARLIQESRNKEKR